MTGKMHLTVVVLLALATEWEKAWSAPVPLRLVDLTHVLDNSTIVLPGLLCFQSRDRLIEFRGVTVKNEEISTTTHIGTHMDAPCEVFPDRFKVAEIPLDRLVAPAAVVDIRDKVANNRDYTLQIEDLLEWERTTGKHLNDVILLVRTGWSKHWGNREAYLGSPGDDNFHFPGVAHPTAEWLVKNRNVYGVGIDTISLDAGQETKLLTHVILYNSNLYGLENLGDMDELPLFGATLHVLPMKIGGGACGAPIRIIASFPDTRYKSGHTGYTSHW